MLVKDNQSGLVEKCLEVVPDRFQLVVLAAYRAQELSMGASSEERVQGSKNTVIALKEIAKKKIDLQELEEHIVANFQQFAFLSNKNS